MPQIVLQEPPVAHFRAHFRLEEAIGATAFHLGAVKRRVRMAEQALTIGGIIRANRDSDAARNKSRSGGTRVLRPQRLHDVLRDASCAARA